MYWAIGAVISAIGSLSVIVALGIALRNLDFLALRAWGYDNSDPDRAASPD